MENGSRSPFVLILSAPSGGGKTTVGQRLLEQSSRLKRVITCTTRNPREGEVQGVDYFFLTPDDFDGRVHRGEFLEYANVFGKRYGTLKSEVLRLLNEGSDVLLIIDVQGAAQARRVFNEDPVLHRALVTVFLTPPSQEELEGRLRGRGTEAEEAVARRLAEAAQEIAQSADFDYLVVSGTREEDLRRMQAIYEAEGLRRARVHLRWE
ncbi:MAG TPA: guanylate kinase [Candidatus Limnocylindria bacterium]|jgi:guanylate kinase|nr:guanylate kinase [Candidatus Limnocylindria bacterium]